jgi:hypothetical protein
MSAGLSRARRRLRALGSAALSSRSSVTFQVNTMNVGADGEAGTLDVFPGTANRGTLRIQAANQVGDTTLLLTNAAMGQATTLTIPDPGAATGSFVLDSQADLALDSTNEINIQIGGVGLLAIDDAAIAANAAAADVAGQACFIETQDGGAGTGAAVAGAALSIKCGDAGAAAAGVGNAGAAGGAITIEGGAASDVGTQASGTGNGGLGGSVNITGGAGGDGGDSSGTDGRGGDIVLTPGAPGSGGNTAARSGVVNVADGKNLYVGAIAMPATTEGTNWIGLDVGTAPVGAIATAIAIYTDGDNLSFLHADGTTDDLGT